MTIQSNDNADLDANNSWNAEMENDSTCNIEFIVQANNRTQMHKSKHGQIRENMHKFANAKRCPLNNCHWLTEAN